MKRMITLLLVLCLCVGLCACSPSITEIVLSTNSCELVEEETYQLSYILFPENASKKGLKWVSANEAIATVDSDGRITAIAPGQTTISITNNDGIVRSCSVTVLKKPAYERLSVKEQEFLNCFLKHLDQFKNRESVKIRAVEVDGSGWTVEASAQNGFGGTNTSIYFLNDSLGFWDWDALDIDIDMEITPDNSFDIALLNEALDDMR